MVCKLDELMFQKKTSSTELDGVLETFFCEVSLPDDGKLAANLQTFASPGLLELDEEPGDEAVAQCEPSVLEGVGEAQPVLNLVQTSFPTLRIEIAATSFPGMVMTPRIVQLLIWSSF